MIDQKYLKECLLYDPETGKFTWIDRPTYHFSSESYKKKFSSRYLGQEAGNHSPPGYITIRIAGKSYSAHRLAFLWMNGGWPPSDVDHKDGNRSNNSWSNLRPASRSENNQNRSIKTGNKSRHLGVYFQSGKYRAKIMIDREQKHLGYFETAKQAHDAYLIAKEKLHEFQPTPRQD